MATIVNQPPQAETSNGLGTLAALLMILLMGFLFFYYGLPALRNNWGGGGTNINVPRQIDVNVNQGGE